MEVVKLFWALYNISMQHFFRVGLLEQPATRGGPRYTGRKSGLRSLRSPARHAGKIRNACDILSIAVMPRPTTLGGSLGLTLREALNTYKGYASLPSPKKTFNRVSKLALRGGASVTLAGDIKKN